MNDDDITGFFASITPEDFIAGVGAEMISAETGGLADTAFFHRPIPARGTFTAFVSEHMDVLRIAFASCDGEIFPIAAVAAGNQVHYFKAEDEESLRQFTARVHRFASMADARWLFIFKKITTQVQGSQMTGVYWMAGERTGKDVAYRHGYFDVAGQVLGQCNEAHDGSRPTGFTQILEDN